MMLWLSREIIIKEGGDFTHPPVTSPAAKRRGMGCWDLLRTRARVSMASPPIV
jgi:hypothetical protein